MSKIPKITSLLFLCNMLRKKWAMQLIFYMQISMKGCYKLILRYFYGYGQAFAKFPKKQICNVFTISLKKLEIKLTFLIQINIPNSFLTVEINILGLKVFYSVRGMIMKTWRLWWWKWSGILKVLKIISLQCLCNISKKKLWMGFSTSDVSYRLLMKVARHVQSTKIGRLLTTNFSNILRKSISTAFVLYCGEKHSDTLLGCIHVCRYLFLGGCGQKWAWPFRSSSSQIYCISRQWIDKMNWYFCMLTQI